MNLYTVKIECVNQNLSGLEESYYVVSESFDAAIAQAKASFCEEFEVPMDDDIQALKCEWISDDVVMPSMVAGEK